MAPDKFKGSLSAMEVCQAVAQGVRRALPEVHFDFAPLADGGDGSLAVLAKALDLQEVSLKVEDPLGRPIVASYYRSKDAAFVEMAAASGMVLLSPEERDPQRTSTFGTGLLMRHAIEGGLQRIFLFLGGSATNDAGMGIAEALGFKFIGPDGKYLRGQGKNLARVTHIMPPANQLSETPKIICLCDVQNPLLGKNGATQVYAPQKGATAQDVQELELGMTKFAKRLHTFTGEPVDAVPGGGAAGGIAAGLMALFSAEIRSGMKAIQQWLELEVRMQWADLVITGEGKLDAQTLEGKVVDGVLSLASRSNREAIVVTGVNTLSDFPNKSYPTPDILAIMDVAPDETSAISNAADYVAELLEAYFEERKKASPTA